MAYHKSNVVLLLMVLCFSITIESSHIFAVQSLTEKQNTGTELGKAKFQGRVVSDNGPVSSATIFAYRLETVSEPYKNGTSSAHPNELPTKSVTNADGEFQFDLESDQPLKILVVAKGFASQNRTITPTAKSKLVIELKDQKSKLQGRIIDSQGRGVANAKLRLLSFRASPLTIPIPSEFGNSLFQSLTDEKGWFEFPGFDQSSLGQIRVTGQGIVPATLTTESFKSASHDIVLVAQPARSVIGTVVDRISKSPIQNVAITPGSGGTTVEVDSDGKFELNGLPAFQPLALTATPTGDKPYHSIGVPVPLMQGFDPAEVKIELQPGVWITCNVRDFSTGEPAKAQVYYFPTPANKQFQSFVESFQTRRIAPSRPTDASGNAKVVAVPGPGAIVVVARRYKPNESVNKLTPEQRGQLTQIAGPELTAVKWIEPKDFDDEVELSFVVSKGRKIAVELAGKQFEETDQFVIHRAESKGSYSQSIQGPKFVAKQFHPGETRQVLIHGPQLGLGAVLDLKADAKSPVTVKLSPTGGVMGQVVNKNGDAQPGLRVKFEIAADEGYQEIATQIFTDANGRFEKPSLIPTLDYRITAFRPTQKKQQMMMASPAVDSRWYLAEELRINGGEMVDLGSVVLGATDQPKPTRVSRKETVPKKTIAKENTLPSSISGVITDDSDEPIHNATITLNTWPNRSDDLKQNLELTPSVLAQATTDSSGSFQMSIAATLEEKIINTPGGKRNAAIVVVAPKRGTIQIPLAEISDPKKLNLKMNREMVIRGRIIASQGFDIEKTRLVCGSEIQVYEVETLEKIISSLKEGKSLELLKETFEPVTTIDPLAGGPPTIWETSSSGAFLVQNIPINGILELHALNESGQLKTITVVSRPIRGFEFTPNEGSPMKMQLQGSRVKMNLGELDSAK